MPRVKKTTATAKKQPRKPKVQEIPQETNQSFSSQLKLSESYVSLVLGAIAVAILAILFFVFLKGSNTLNKKINAPIVNQPSNQPTKTVEKIYILKDGEGLWDVAVKFYGDGYKWQIIAQANHLENPDSVTPGTKLFIPVNK